MRLNARHVAIKWIVTHSCNGMYTRCSSTRQVNEPFSLVDWNEPLSDHWKYLLTIYLNLVSFAYGWWHSIARDAQVSSHVSS